tara:strand:- start:357 stop:1157 length:801 start_codon:yes stop_codon:yes gene_type:complete
MASKYFQKTIRPDIINGDVSAVIQGSGNDKPFGAGDILFDWQAVDLPKGTDAIVDACIHMYGEDGGATPAKDMYLIVAKTNDGVAPTTLGDVNSAVAAGACPELPDVLLGLMKFEGTSAQGLLHVATGSIYYWSPSGSNGQKGAIVIEAGINPSGINRGAATQRIYVAGIAGGALDFSTGVLVNGAITSDSATDITVDGVDPRQAFRVGDTVYLHDVDTALGTIASMDSTSVILNAAIAGGTDLADDDELVNASPLTIKLGFRNPR